MGIGILLMHAFFALLVLGSLREAVRRGSAVAGTVYLVVAVATIAWIWKAAEWLR